ncbi:MAG: DUF4956 domain-containing protein [Candidatus Nomurabacteria bacterium]|jgi:hypothetical protein|nr:DUF4956 domain-containing protein [Candidatus Nomurabacteria bacterium]
MFESIFNSESSATLTLGSALVALLAAVVMGVGLSFCYTQLNKGKITAKSFGVTLVVLPAVITIIVALVGNNVARAFSIAGIFSIIRFRSMQQGPKELAFVLLSMAIGLGCGMGFVGYAVIFGVVLVAVTMGAELVFRDKHEYKILKIFIPESLDYGNALGGVIQKYASEYSLTEVKTADLGSLYKLTYKVALLSGADEKEMIDELRTKNGNLTISLTNYYEEIGR